LLKKSTFNNFKTLKAKELPMFSHIFIGTNKFDTSFSFYAGLMGALGHVLKFSEPSVPWAGWKQSDVDRPLFILGAPFNGEAASPGNGQMFAFIATTRAMVDKCHSIAIGLGGACEGKPGLRPQYHSNYYGAYFRDLDGNKICVCCHVPI
jgi:catechol 2,3-dioxygenase-like lactoylglutathione lyase family enzyme